MPIDGYLRFVIALIFVLALIVGLAWLYRRYGQGRVAAPRRRPGGVRGRRLSIVEAVALDSRRRLVLVRRDDREHLIIIGTQGETLVESGIVAEDGRTMGSAIDDRWAAPDDLTPDDEPSCTDPSARDERRPAGRSGSRSPKPTSFLRLVRQTTRESS